jgi:hypothetical protein
VGIAPPISDDALTAFLVDHPFVAGAATASATAANNISFLDCAAASLI